jgi:hypothetical protein
LVFLLLIACGGTTPTAQGTIVADQSARRSTRGSTDKWFVLQISRVQVSPTKVDGATWDGAQEKGPDGCGLIGTIGTSAAGPVGGAVATFLCERSGNEQAQRDPRAPDLFVQVTTGVVKYRTPVAVDTFGEVFDYPLVAPLDGIGPAGLEIQVLDQDDDVGSGELIGMVRVSAEDVAAAATRKPPLLDLHDSQVKRLEIAVLPYEAPRSIDPIKFDVSQTPRTLNARARAGELVRIAAKGTYSVASNGEAITTAGYENGEKRGYNVQGFESANHAAAIALIGRANETHSSLVVGKCLQTIAPVTGAISVGINETDQSNNVGFVVFDVDVGLPTMEAWKTGKSEDCSLATEIQKPRQGEPK